MIKELYESERSVEVEKHRLALGILETYFGKGVKDRKQNYSFYCPFCKHRKRKLAINIVTGKYNCYTCHPPTKGKNPASLLKKVGADHESIAEISKYYSNKKFLEEEQTITIKVTLPKEFKQIEFPGNTPQEKRACIYLKGRGISQMDVIKYNIGFCETGKYKNRIIIPSYDSRGRLNYFVARTIEESNKKTYDSPQCDKSKIVGFEYYINWDVPIILCEGAFDALAIKRNAIPLFGKTINQEVMKKIVKSNVKTVYLALDDDAIKAAYDYAETLINYGKDVYCLELGGKDPSKIGFNKMIRVLQKAKQLTAQDILLMRMKNIMKMI